MRFHRVKAPTVEEINTLVHRISHRVTRFLEKKGWRLPGQASLMVLWSVLMEFGILGFLAGVVGVWGAEGLTALLETQYLKLSVHFHFYYWWSAPLLMVVAVTGVMACRSLFAVAPARVLNA